MCVYGTIDCVHILCHYTYAVAHVCVCCYSYSIHVCVCDYTYTVVHVCVCDYTYTVVHVCVWDYTLCTYIMSLHICSSTCVCMFLFIQYTCVYTCTCMWLYIYSSTYTVSVHIPLVYMYVWLYL